MKRSKYSHEQVTCALRQRREENSRLKRLVAALTPTIRIFSSAEYCLRVLRRIAPTVFSDYRPGYRFRAGAGPRRASQGRPRRAVVRATVAGSERSPCMGFRRLRADGPRRWRSRTCCAVCHDFDSRRPAFCVRTRGRSGRYRRARPSRRGDGRARAGWRC